MNKLMEMKFIIVFSLLLQAIILNVVNISKAEPILSEIFRCKTDSGTVQTNSPYKTNLMSALNKLATETTKDPGFSIASAGDKPNEKVTAVALCAGYLKADDCVSCVKKTIWLLQQKCPNQKAAASWRVTCMVRYGAPVVNDYDLWFVAHEVSGLKAKDGIGLEKTMPRLVASLMKDVSPIANVRVKGYAFGNLSYGSSQNLYMVMQCTPNILSDDCNKCLGHVSREIKPCCSGAIAAAMLTPNCYMRYAHSDFRVL